MSELSHFEELAAQTPKKQPYAILIGTVVLIIVLVLIKELTPTQVVEDLKEVEEAAPAAVQAADDGEEI